MAQPQGSHRRILAISQRRGGVRVPGVLLHWSCDSELWRAGAAAGVCSSKWLGGDFGTKGGFAAGHAQKLCLRCEEGFGSKKLVTLSTTLVPRTPQLPL